VDARVFWVGSGGVEYGVSVPDLSRVLRDPRRLALLTEPRARELVGAGGDSDP
jgi:hypothetical protein